MNSRYVDILIPVPVNVALFGKKVFANIIKIGGKMRLILEWGGPPPKMTGVLIRGDRDRHTGRMPCEDRGRDWSDVPIR